MKTKDLALYSIQSNMLGSVVNNDICEVLLANGNYLLVKCSNNKEASEINDSLLFYPIINMRDNNAIMFDFEFTLEYVLANTYLTNK